MSKRPITPLSDHLVSILVRYGTHILIKMCINLKLCNVGSKICYKPLSLYNVALRFDLQHSTKLFITELKCLMNNIFPSTSTNKHQTLNFQRPFTATNY